MMKLGAQSELSGMALKSMDEWSKRHAPDPRSSMQGAELSEEQQKTLLRWAARRTDQLASHHSARRGAPAACVLHFGAYRGLTLGALVRASRMGGCKSLANRMLISSRSSEPPEPGDYILWLASAAFNWSFPYHLDLYFALRQLDIDSCWVSCKDGLSSNAALHAVL